MPTNKKKNTPISKKLWEEELVKKKQNQVFQRKVKFLRGRRSRKRKSQFHIFIKNHGA